MHVRPASAELPSKAGWKKLLSVERPSAGRGEGERRHLSSGADGARLIQSALGSGNSRRRSVVAEHPGLVNPPSCWRICTDDERRMPKPSRP